MADPPKDEGPAGSQFALTCWRVAGGVLMIAGAFVCGLLLIDGKYEQAITIALFIASLAAPSVLRRG